MNYDVKRWKCLNWIFLKTGQIDRVCFFKNCWWTIITILFGLWFSFGTYEPSLRTLRAYKTKQLLLSRVMETFSWLALFVGVRVVSLWTDEIGVASLSVLSAFSSLVWFESKLVVLVQGYVASVILLMSNQSTELLTINLR